MSGWIRLQNGYYLPMQSDDGKVQFLFKVSKRAQPQNTEMKRIGSNTPLFKRAEKEDVASLLGGTVAVVEPDIDGESTSSETPNGDSETTKSERLRAAVHMDAMAFGMGCCCLQITFQAKDIEESRFLFDQLNVMAPM
jgi:Glutamate-cysteine ligase